MTKIEAATGTTFGKYATFTNGERFIQVNATLRMDRKRKYVAIHGIGVNHMPYEIQLTLSKDRKVALYFGDRQIWSFYETAIKLVEPTAIEELYEEAIREPEVGNF